jgi:hypothetical protein
MIGFPLHIYKGINRHPGKLQKPPTVVVGETPPNMQKRAAGNRERALGAPFFVQAHAASKQNSSPLYPAGSTCELDGYST